MSLIESLKPSDHTQQKEWMKYDRYLGRTISPSYIESVATCPAKAYLEKLTKSSYDAFVSIAADAQGSAVHNALEQAFNFLQSGKSNWKSAMSKSKGTYNPSSKQIEYMLRRSQTRAELSLKQHIPINDPSIGKMQSYIHDVIFDYGKRYLDDEQVFLGSEMNVQTRGLKAGAQIGGNLDLALYNARTKEMDLIDFKYARKKGADIGHDFLSVMKPGAMDAPEQHIQPKIYAYSLLERNAQIEKIHFMYDIYWDFESGTKKGRQVVKGKNPFTRRDMASLKAELSDRVSEVLTHERQLSASLKRARGSNVLRALAQVRKGACNPAVCGSCPFKYQCSFKSFVEEARYKAKGTGGELFADTELRKLSHLDDRQFNEQMSKQYSEFVNEKKRIFTVDRVKQLRSEFHFDRRTAYDIAKVEAEELGKSYENMRYYKRGQFVDSLEKGAWAARARLPYSLLDPDARASWMTTTIQRNLKDYSEEHVERLAKDFDVPVNLAREVVIDNVYKDRNFAAHLHGMVMDNTIEVLRQEGISLGKYEGQLTYDMQRDVGKALKQYHRTINRNVALTVQGALDQEFVRYVMTVDQEKIRSLINVAERQDIKAITKGLVDMGLIKSDPDKFLSQVAQSESFGAVIERSRLGSPKFPLGSLMIAGMLTYIAGAESISRIVGNKIEKFKFYSTHQDDQVDDGTHSSVYTVSRRLLYSDFGSSVRFVMRRSSQVLRHLRDYRDFMKDAVTLLTGYTSTKAQGFAVHMAKAMGVGLEKSVKSLVTLSDSTIKEPRLLLAGTAAAAGFFAVIPHLATDREIRNRTEERRRAFKAIKKAKWNSSSGDRINESPLREAYRSFSPFGSGLFLEAAANFIAPAMRKIALMCETPLGKKSFVEAASMVKTHLLEAWQGMKHRAEDVYAQSDLRTVLKDLRHDIAESHSKRVLTTGIDVVSNAAQKVKATLEESKLRQRMMVSSLDRAKGLSTRLRKTGADLSEKDLKRTLGKAASETIHSVDEIAMAFPAGAPAVSTIAGAGTMGTERALQHVHTQYRQNAYLRERGGVDPDYYQSYRTETNRKDGVQYQYPRRHPRQPVDMSSLMEGSGVESPGMLDLYTGGAREIDPGVGIASGGASARHIAMPASQRRARVMNVPHVIEPGRAFDAQWADTIGVNRFVMSRSRTRGSWYTNGSNTLQAFHEVVHGYQR